MITRDRIVTRAVHERVTAAMYRVLSALVAACIVYCDSDVHKLSSGELLCFSCSESVARSGAEDCTNKREIVWTNRIKPVYSRYSCE